MLLIQLQVLNLILSTGDISFITVKGLNSSYFPQYRSEFNFIYGHFKKYNQIPDLATFLNSFPDFEVIEVNESVDYLLSELYKTKNTNYLVETFNNIRELLKNGKTDEAVSVLTNASSMMSSSKHLDAVNILDDISRYDSYVEKCNDFSKYYVSTGFKELDSVIGGWDRTSELAVIIARAGVGKTWCLLKSVVASVERGLNVGLYSGEMDLNKVSYRLDTLMSNISNTSLVRGNINVASNYKSYLDKLKQNHKGSLYVLTPDMIDGEPTVEVLRGFVEKYNLDILFVDQQTLLFDKSRSRTSFEKAANISKDLKMLQVTKHIPIITVTQQNRSAIEDGGFAGTEHIGQSDRIGQDSTTILAVSQKDGILTLHIAKARDGGTDKTIKYAIDLDKGVFDFIPEEDTSGDKAIELMNRYETDLDDMETPFN